MGDKAHQTEDRLGEESRSEDGNSRQTGLVEVQMWCGVDER